MVDLGVTTTPVLHYVVKATNDKSGEYGVPTEGGYMEKMSGAFKTLMVSWNIRSVQQLTTTQGSRGPLQPLFVDCANGVGALGLAKLSKYLASSLPLKPLNDAIDTPGALNSQCGADYVKTRQALPPSIASAGILAHDGARACSLDGDADRLVYYYLQDKKKFRLLDGDKIAVMVALFIRDLLKKAKLAEGDDALEVGAVQTAYANGSSTKYLHQVGCK